jgi:hypothetical protein
VGIGIDCVPEELTGRFCCRGVVVEFIALWFGVEGTMTGWRIDDGGTAGADSGAVCGWFETGLS